MKLLRWKRKESGTAEPQYSEDGGNSWNWWNRHPRSSSYPDLRGGSRGIGTYLGLRKEGYEIAEGGVDDA